MKAPSFDGDPRNWPMFIHYAFVHDAVSSDSERIAHLHEALSPSTRKDIGGALLNPGLYQHALNELHRRYGNPQIVSQACTTSLLKLRPFKDNDFTALRFFSADLHSVVATLRLGGYGMELYSHVTLSQLVSKLPPALKSRWGEKSWAMQPTLASVEDLDQWLDGVAMTEQSIRASSLESPHQRPVKPNEERRRTHKPNVFNITSATLPKPVVDDSSPRCPGCNSKHQYRLEDCRKFKELPLDKRAKIVKYSNLCLRCLGNDHLSRECTRTELCPKPECDGVHHPLLHGSPRLYPKRTRPKPFTPTTFFGSVAAKSAGSRILLPIVPIILKANGKEFPLYALLDPGSEISVIKGKTANLLDLRGRVEKVSTRTVNGETKYVDRKIVNFSVSSIDGRCSFDISDAHVMETFQLNKRSINLASLSKLWPHLAHVPVYSTTHEDVAILIGHDHPAAIEIFETRKDPFDQ